MATRVQQKKKGSSAAIPYSANNPNAVLAGIDSTKLNTPQKRPDKKRAKEIPQTQPLNKRMKENNAGGFSYEIDAIGRLKRFLVLGCEGGTYYTKEQELGYENSLVVKQLLDNGQGKEVVDVITQFSVEGRCPKTHSTIFCLAVVARMAEDVEVRRYAYTKMKEILRIPTHLFEFIKYAESLSTGTGWGRAHKKAVQQWYVDKPVTKLAFAVTKYQQREGWSHKDVLRLCHAKASSNEQNLLFRYITTGKIDPTVVKDEPSDVLMFLRAVEEAKACHDPDRLISLMKKFRLAREHLPTEHLGNIKIWEAMLETMPMTAMIRNLGKMSSIGVLKKKKNVALVRRKLQDEEQIKRSKVHPMTILLAMATYRNGHGDRGKLSWEVNDKITAALEDAFELAFKNVVPTGKRFFLAMDVSGSMGAGIQGTSITAREGSVAMAMVTLNSEPACHTVAFQTSITPLPMKQGDSLSTLLKKTSRLPFGGTDCAQPMVYALRKRIPVDVFVVYTDNETYFGSVHPSAALNDYRKGMGINSKLVVVGMTSTSFTIADPQDKGMLDVVGFDSATPSIISEFAAGTF